MEISETKRFFPKGFELGMLWFNFILGLNYMFVCFKVIIIHYHTQKQKKRKFEPRIKLNHNRYNIKLAK